MGADAHNLSIVLDEGGFSPAACVDIAAAAAEIGRGCGALLIAEEALLDERHRQLGDALDRQPPWSDIPVLLVVTGGAAATQASAEAMRRIGPRNNVILLERPLRRRTLLAALDAALRARRRQYEVQALLQERDALLASLESRVADRTARLAELNGELEAFSYSVSHDLRAPLRAMGMYASILCEEFHSQLTPEARNYAERILQSARKMDRLTQDVLTLSRLTRAEIQLEDVDIDALLADVLEQYPDLAAGRRYIEIAAPLGRVRAHGPSLTQCLSNLLQNALKFVAPGQTPRVRVYSEQVGPVVRLSIHDNGPGIAPEHHQRIFGIFERAVPKSIEGTGIGLAIARKAVERMDGVIGVDSSPGQGARFWIDLRGTGAPPPRESAAHAGTAALQGPT